jgi:diguanylate cyclase (GGDEF)-like protein
VAYGLVAVPNLHRATFIRQIVLESLNLDVLLVRNGDEALQLLTDAGLPALLIVDLSLPRVDGLTIIQTLRHHPSGHATRIIAVGGHESLRSAARALASSLDISHVLSLDVERHAWPSLLADLLPAYRIDPHPDVHAVIERAALDARHRFHVPLAIGYARIGAEEHLSYADATRETASPIAMGDFNEHSFLRQVADATGALVIPRIDTHPVFAEPFARHLHPMLGVIAIPILAHRADVRAALSLFDTTPMMLSASEIDAFCAFGRSVARDLDGVSLPPHEPKISVDLFEDVEALQQLASTDSLTGLENRRGGETHIAIAIARAKREQHPLSVILLDIDRFKNVNDTFGHQAGDQLLRDVSQILKNTVRAYDILVRWGGEEFLLVLPGVDLDPARLLAERVRLAIETMDTHGLGCVTVSAGVARFDADYDFAATLRAADQRLYQAKAAGRNRTV